MHKSAHRRCAPRVMAAAWGLEGRHCGHTGLSGNIKWPSHGSPLAWVVRPALVRAARGRIYTHAAKVKLSEGLRLQRVAEQPRQRPHMECHLTSLIKARAREREHAVGAEQIF